MRERGGREHREEKTVFDVSDPFFRFPFCRWWWRTSACGTTGACVRCIRLPCMIVVRCAVPACITRLDPADPTYLPPSRPPAIATATPLVVHPCAAPRRAQPRSLPKGAAVVPALAEQRGRDGEKPRPVPRDRRAGGGYCRYAGSPRVVHALRGAVFVPSPRFLQSRSTTHHTHTSPRRYSSPALEPHW